jgi:histidine triad (HIT) family protein
MDNPLTQEQLQQYNDIFKLPPEEQKEKFNEFLKTLNPEQLAFIQQQQCVFCSLISGKNNGKKIYEDDSVTAFLDIRPAAKGHVIVVPNDHVMFSTELKDVGHFFTIVNKVVSKIYDVYKTGSNIFAANGAEAGQQVPHFIVHVIPRYENDGLQLRWDGKNISEDEINDVQKNLQFEKDVEIAEPEEVLSNEVDEEEMERLP